MTRRSTSFLLFGVLAVLAALSFWWVRNKGQEVEGASLTRSEPSAQSKVEAAPTRSGDEVEPAELVAPGASDRDERVPLVGGLRGRVRWQDSSHIETATVHACDLQNVTGLSAAARSTLEWESFIRALPSAPVDSDGRFAFDFDDDSTARWVAFLAQAGHRPAWQAQVESGDALELVTEPANPVTVRLRRSEPEPATEGATLFALYTVSGAAQGELDPQTLWMPFAHTVNETASIAIARGAGEVTLWAVAGEQRSAEWRGSLEGVDEVVLDLDGTFVARGSLPDLGQFDPKPSNLRVTASRKVGDERQRLGAGSVGEDGRWNLSDLAADGTSPLVFRLEGVGLATQEVTLPPAEPGTEVEVRFELTHPQRLIVVLNDFEEHPIPGTDLQASWMSDGLTVLSSPFSTGEDGIGELVEPPLGDVFIHVTKQGYSGGRFGPYSLNSGSDDRVTIRIGKAGRIAGRCLRGGEPIETFSIRYWKDTPWNVLEHRVSGQEDGSFAIEDAPLGTVQLLASSPDCPGSPPATVEVAKDSEAWIEIELPLPGTAVGRVTDADTGQPIPSASIQALTAASDQDSWPWGEAALTNALGEFQGVPVASPLTLLEISAPGYAKVTRRAMAGPGEVFDCQTVELPGSQELIVRLIGTGSETYSQYIASVDISGSTERVHFDDEGLARFEKVSPGQVWLTVVSPGGATSYIDVRLKSGEEWLVEVALDTGSRIDVEVRSRDQALLDGVLWAGISYATVGGEYVHYYEKLDAERRTTFTCAGAGEVALDIVDGAFQPLAWRAVSLDSSGPTHVPIELSEQSYRVRLLDSEANLLPSTRVSVFLPQNPVSWGVVSVTDQEGIATLQGFEPGPVMLSVHLPNESANNIPVELGSASQDPIDVVVDTSGRLDFTVHDGDLPLPGLSVQLRRWRTGPPVVTSLSDPQGAVDFHALTPGDYVALVDQPGFWPASIEIEARADRPRYALQVRRLGTLELRLPAVTGSTGQANIELVSMEFGEGVSDWLRDGRVETSTDSMVSDAGGVLVLYGLPHGAYSWQASAAGRPNLQGELVVIPSGITTVVLE